MTKNKINPIKKISIFSDLSDDEIGTIATFMKELSLENNAILFSEGESGSEMFIVLKGRAEISVRTADGKEITLAEMGSGSFFGEMSLIENLPRSATCRLVEKCSLLSLDNKSLLFLMQSHSAIAEKILFRMLTITTSRLYKTSALLSDMVQWGEKARLRVITDEATGLFNRRFLDDTLQSEFRKAVNGHTFLSIAMVDLDHFGSVNKTYDEAFGDSVILKASEVFKSGFRPGDILSRYGGDEFTVLFPGTTPEDARALCNEVCAKIARLEFPEHPDFRITASIGVAAIPDHAYTIETLLAKADKALYAAKENGRNQTAIALKNVRHKQEFKTIAEQNRVSDRILALLIDKN
jgi:diguanylate cyclase (GGDEF)-like protein